MTSNLMTQQRWIGMMRAFDAPDCLDMFGELVAAYSQSHRHYHDVNHVSDCLRQLDEAADQATEQATDLATSAAEVEAALWFHDAVYKPTASDNEQQSAQWARSFLRDIGATMASCSNVYEHILATRHTAAVPAGDAALVVDVDLSILGRTPAQYTRFEHNVRREYKWVPMPLFRRKRIEILRSFLDREYIYVTTHFRGRYESAARQNLMSAINALQEQ